MKSISRYNIEIWKSYTYISHNIWKSQKLRRNKMKSAKLQKNEGKYSKLCHHGERFAKFYKTRRMRNQFDIGLKLRNNLGLEQSTNN